MAGMLGAMAEVGESPEGTGAIVMRGNALTLPFPDASFDRVIVSEVLEHIADDAGVLAEIRRVLRPDGTARTHALHSPYWWLRCLAGPTNDTNKVVEAYHKLLVWDMVKAPWITRTAESLLARPLGKSLVAYAGLPAESGRAR